MVEKPLSPSLLESIINEISNTCKKVDLKSMVDFGDDILQAEKVFVAGAGRSGLIMRTFAMRLMHLTFQSYVVGETITPAAEDDDLLIIGSGSGETDTMISIAKQANRLGISIDLITVSPDSTIGSLASAIIEIPAYSPKKNGFSHKKSVQPMGSQFEQSLFLILESIILYLIQKKEVSEDEMFTMHANLE